MPIRKTRDEFIRSGSIIYDNKYDYGESVYRNHMVKLLIICPEHGKFMQSPNNHLKGRGCPRCKESKGERRIRRYLECNNIKFDSQKSFDGCSNKSKLNFDFYIPELNMCIEYDEIQHFESISFFGGEKSLKLNKKHDNIKNKFIKENNMRLLRIKYTEYDDIERVLGGVLCELV